MRKKIAWITWERQQRNVSMSRLFSADYYEFNESSRNYLFRILANSFKTYGVFNRGYDVIFVQNPSFFLMAISVFFNVFFNKKLVIDAHNAGVFPLEGKVNSLVRINKLFLKKADLVLVSNKYLQKYLDGLGVDSFAMCDPIPEISKKSLSKYRLSKTTDVFIICSWSDDEPVHLYFSLAKRFPHLKFRISGNFRKRFGSALNDIGNNVELLGFVEESLYFKYISECEIAIDLTTREDCLVCGAYEAISFGVPVILSDTKVNREVFRRGAVFSNCSDDDLSEALQYTIDNYEFLKSEVANMKEELVADELENREMVFKRLMG